MAISEKNRPWGYHVRTCHQSFLAFDNQGALINTTDSGSSPSLFLQPGLLVSGSYVVPARRVVHGLYSPETGKFLTAAAPDVETGVGNVAFAAPTPRGYEHFIFEPAGDAAFLLLPLECRALLERISAPDWSVKTLADLFTHGPLSPELAPILNALICLLSKLQIEALSALLFSLGPRGAENLRHTFAGDITAEFAWPALVDWLTARADLKAPTRLPVSSIDTKLDRLDTEGLNGKFCSLPFECNVALRHGVIPRYQSCVVATARNEGLYLVEWIAHYKAISFDRIFIYSNDNNDGSDDLLKLLADAGEIVWIKSEVSKGTRAQWKAYGHALRVMPDTLDYEWTLFADIDEFFVPNPDIFSSVKDFLNWHQIHQVDAIAVNWLIFGANGHNRWTDDLVVRRFTTSSGDANLHIKTFCRTNSFIQSYPHNPLTHRHAPFVFRNARGGLHEYSAKTGAALSSVGDISFAAIHHYFFKSNEEFLWKSSRSRGDDLRATETTLASLKSNFITGHVDSCHQAGGSRIETFLPGIMQGCARLLQIPGVSAAMVKIKQNYAERVPALEAEAAHHTEMLAAGAKGKVFMDAFRR